MTQDISKKKENGCTTSTSDNPSEIVLSVAKVLEQYGLSRVTYKSDQVEFSLEAALPANTYSSAPVLYATPTAPHAAPTASTTSPAPATPAAPLPAENGKTVKSPMIGVIYLASSPTAQPYVKIGDKVSVDQDLFIVECMKTMNLVKSPYAGVVKDIYVQNGKPVEYDQPLALISVE